jgi:hypothetical protein
MATLASVTATISSRNENSHRQDGQRIDSLPGNDDFTPEHRVALPGNDDFTPEHRVVRVIGQGKKGG